MEPDHHSEILINSPNDDQRMLELGYTPSLSRRLTLKHLLGLTMANVAPSISVILVSTAVFAMGGTFTVASTLIVGFIVILIMMCLAELGSVYPLTGGIYSLAYKIFPGPIMWICLLNILVTYYVGMAGVSLGISVYLKTLVPAIHLPDNVIAIMALCIAAFIASVRVELGALTTAGLVLIESLILGVILIAGLFYPRQHLTEILFHPVVLKGGQLIPVTIGIALPTIAATFNLIVGYESVLGFSEELKGNYKTLIKATVVTALLAIVLVAVPIGAAIVAAHNLSAFLQSPTPVIDAIEQSFGYGIAKVVNCCILISLFSALLAGIMYIGRILYASGRDNIWWKGANRKLIQLNKQQVPSFAVIVSLSVLIIFAFVGALNWLIIFTASCFITMYFMVGFAGFWSRYKFPLERRPYKMPFWPLTPFFIMLFTLLAFLSQEFQYQIGVIIFIVLAFFFWILKKMFPGQ